MDQQASSPGGNDKQRRPMPAHLRQYGWKPGQSGNPHGRKPGQSQTSRLREILAKDDDAAAKALITAGVKAALGDPAQGVPPDFRFWNAIFERMDGKLIERIGVEEGGSIFIGITSDGRRPDLLEAAPRGEPSL